MKQVLRDMLVKLFNSGDIRVGFSMNETKYLQFAQFPSVGILKVIHCCDDTNEFEWLDTEQIIIRV